MSQTQVLPTRARLRVLYLSCHLPWPAISGGRRRELELIRRVASDHDVHLLAVSKTPAEDQAATSRLADCCRAVEVFAAEAAPRSSTPTACRQERRHRSAALTARVDELLAAGTADIVHVEGFYLMQHLPRIVGVPVLLVEQNIEYELEHQRAAALPGAAADLEAYADAHRTRVAEVAAWRRADRVAVLTPEDRATMAAELPGLVPDVVPDGADHVPLPGAAWNGQAVSGTPTIAFVANFAYAPNLDAAELLLREILPRVRAAVPEARLWLVGNEPPASLGRRADRVTVTGRVESVIPYLDRADVVLCPLRIGGGIKVKAIEALRRGRPVVSTPIGAQGLTGAAREAVEIAADPAGLAAATIRLLRDPERRAELSRRARTAAARLPSWDVAAAALTDVYAQLATAPAHEPARRMA